MLTGNDDVDINILLSLNLKDLRYICQTNKYASYLCKNKKISNQLIMYQNKSESIIDIIKKRDGFSVYFNTFNVYATLNKYYDIIKDLNLDFIQEYSDDQSIDDLLDDPIIYIEISCHKISIDEKYNNQFIITFNTSDAVDPIKMSFMSNEYKFKELLLYFYYNHLLLFL